MANSKKRKEIYFEPEDYFPEDIRREFKLGEYSTKAKRETNKKKKKGK